MAQETQKTHQHLYGKDRDVLLARMSKIEGQARGISKMIVTAVTDARRHYLGLLGTSWTEPSVTLKAEITGSESRADQSVAAPSA